MNINSNKTFKYYWQEKLNTLMKVEPRCIHFGVCGGCALQHISYDDQVATKLEIVQNILEAHLKGVTPEIVPSPNPYEYRLRMDYVTATDPIKPPNQRIGLRKRKSFNHVVDLSECHLIPVKLFPKIRSVFNKALELGLVPYDLVKKTGFLRYLVVRQQEDKVMLIIVTSGDENQEIMEGLAEFSLAQGFTTVYWLVNSADADSSFGDIHKFWGEEYLKVNFTSGTKQLVMNIGPNTFSQNNIPGFNLLLSYVREQIEKMDVSKENLLDLYAGVGSIGLALSDMFEKVYACELVTESVELAKVNAQQNGVDNYNIVAGDVKELSTYMSGQDAEIVVVDPPRTGLEPKGVQEVLSLDPKYIIYISCNPVTQAQDLDLLSEKYNLITSKAFDMFPQTFHLENVIVLKRIDTGSAKELT